MSDVTRYLDDPMLFREEQLILPDGRRLGTAMESWQRESIFAPLDERQEDGRYRYRLCYFELPRGHAKTTAIAGEAVTQLTLGGYDWRGHVVAGDRDQARELFDAAVGFVRRNPVLDAAFTILRDRIVANHTGASLRVHSADAPTAHGLVVDWVAFDEFWNQPSRDLWDAFYTAMVKRANWRAIVITTAGYDRETICWEVRELARQRPDFYAFVAPGQLASWISEEEIERQRATLPPHVFQRLHENKWVEGSGSFITPEELRVCVDDRLFPQARGWPRDSYFAGVDLGLKRDRTAVAIVHVAQDTTQMFPTGAVVLDDLMVWEGTRKKPVQIAEVEEWIAFAMERFNIRRIGVDPWQAQSTLQTYRGRWPVEEFVFSPQNVARLSSNLYHIISTRRLRLYPDADLERELLQLEAVQTSYGWRIDHRPGKHDDRAIALGIACLLANDHRVARRPTRLSTARVGRRTRNRSVARVRGGFLYVDEKGEAAWRPARERR